MAKKRKPGQSSLVLRAGESIGAPAAEQDESYLKDCFVKLPLVDLLRDVNDPHCLVLGRTGSGKSALLWYLERNVPEASRINPGEASFEYVANSTIIRYFNELGVELHVFYQYLWKHIIVVHVIRDCLNVKTEASFSLLLEKLRVAVTRDQKKAAVIKYLERWNRGFWIDAEEVSREVTSGVVKKLSAELGISPDKLEGKLSMESSNEEERKSIRFRAQRIVNDLQMRELNETITALNDLMADRVVGHHILIDDLDEEWGGNIETQYELIRALIESIKTFRRIGNLKIVVVMREDLFEGMLRAVKDVRFQPEKYDGLICRIRWKDDQLYQVIDERLNKLFKQRYTGQRVSIDHVFPADVRGRAVRAYIVERTLKRPRDAIAFVNNILASAEGASLPLTARIVLASEPNYSRDRLAALIREWQACHPLISSYLDAISRDCNRVAVSELGEEQLGGIALEVDGLDRKPVDEVELIASRVFERNKEHAWPKLAQALVACLFKVGAVAVKLQPEVPYKYCYDEHSTIQPMEIQTHAKIMPHAMIAPALGAVTDHAEAA